MSLRKAFVIIQLSLFHLALERYLSIGEAHKGVEVINLSIASELGGIWSTTTGFLHAPFGVVSSFERFFEDLNRVFEFAHREVEIS